MILYVYNSWVDHRSPVFQAIHLIKAVSLLLRFTPEEQKLIRDTLEWKMSWFGGSQPPAVLRGQTSKVIPPSY